MKRRVTVLTLAIGSVIGMGLGFSIPSSADVHPTPTVTATATPTPTPSLPTVPPTVNPFAGCNFSTTFSFTFDPLRGRFVREVVPAIVCDQGGRVRVYDLVPGRG